MCDHAHPDGGSFFSARSIRLSACCVDSSHLSEHLSAMHASAVCCTSPPKITPCPRPQPSPGCSSIYQLAGFTASARCLTSAKPPLPSRHQPRDPLSKRRELVGRVSPECCQKQHADRGGGALSLFLVALFRLVKEQVLSVTVVERSGETGPQVLLVKRPEKVRLHPHLGRSNVAFEPVALLALPCGSEQSMLRTRCSPPPTHIVPGLLIQGSLACEGPP